MDRKDLTETVNDTFTVDDNGNEVFVGFPDEDMNDGSGLDDFEVQKTKRRLDIDGFIPR